MQSKKCHRSFTRDGWYVRYSQIICALFGTQTLNTDPAEALSELMVAPNSFILLLSALCSRFALEEELLNFRRKCL